MSGKSGGPGGGFLEGLSTLVEKLSDLAEKGERLQKSGDLGSSNGKVRGSYGVDLRVGLGGAGPQPNSQPQESQEQEGGPSVEPVGKEESRPRPAVQPIREPLVDVFDEAAGLLVVAQLPGVPCREILLELRGDILTIDAAHDDLTYHKELLLPRRFSKQQLHAGCRNGVLEIRLSDEAGSADG